MKSRIFKFIFAILILINVSFQNFKCLNFNESINNIDSIALNETNLNDLNSNIPDSVKSDLNDLNINSINPKKIQNFSIQNFFKTIFSKVLKKISKPIQILANCLAIILIAALFNSLKPNFFNNELNGILGTITSICTCGVILSPIIELISNISKTIVSFGNFMLCFIPAYTSSIALSGGTISSINYSSSVFFLAQIFSSITADVLLPVTGAFLAMSISSSISNCFDISGLTAVIKKIVIYSLTTLLTIFIGLFAIKTSISAASDGLGLKTAKMFSASFIPIVGKSLGEALTTIFGGLNLIKSTIGGFGILICALTLLPPILTVCFFLISISISSGISKAMNVPIISKTMASVKDCLSILLSFLVCYAILIISTISLMINLKFN